jgi:hypothetical protein
MSEQHHPIITPLFGLKYEEDEPPAGTPEWPEPDPDAPLYWDGSMSLDCTCGWHWTRVVQPQVMTGARMSTWWNDHVTAAQYEVPHRGQPKS